VVIGISGRISSGKDLVAKIIQSITSGDRLDKVEEIVLNNWIDPYTPWEVRKFADKLKDIVCILIGCNRDQLEDRNFKEKELGEEWWYYKDRINHFIYSYDTFKDLEVVNHGSLELVKLTPRLLLQLIGTDCMRNIIHPDTWVNSLMSEYKGIYRGLPSEYIPGKNLTYPDWIISDMRFPNELKAVKRKGGITIRIERPTFYYRHKITGEIERSHSGLCDGDIYVPVPNSEIVEHASETGLDNANFDYVIKNNGSVADLIKSVYEILIKTGIVNER
jgi:hypothetical protein